MVDKWIGKVAIVTGASAGIGKSIFIDFAKNGINVIGLARRSERVEAIIKDLGSTKGKAYAYKCDVSDPKSVTEAFKWIESKFGVVNILVNNAGISRTGGVLDDNDDAFRKANEIFNTNLIGLVQVTREAFKLMKKSDDYGLIININSVAGHYVPNIPMSFGVYPASKYAVTGLTETIRQELGLLGNKKVRITSLSPGFVDTEIMEASGHVMSMTEDMIKQFGTMPCLASEDISHSVMFLLSTNYNTNITELTIRPTGEKM